MGKTPSKKIVDVVFIDLVGHKPYNDRSLENDSLGGTESSTIRLAEGMASHGLSVVVIQNYEFDEYRSAKGVRYLPVNQVNSILPRNTIHLRSASALSMFKNSKQFIWFHDMHCEEYNVTTFQKQMLKHKVTGIGVSDWHVNILRKAAPKATFQRIYCPVDELCYQYPRKPCDINQLVWMSSPHKGLNRAIIEFNQMWKENNNLKLVVFNPGYWYETEQAHPNIVYLPACKKDSMRAVIAHSLCLFYPTVYEETFGLVAAEANALGIPVACYKVAALAESCGNVFAEDRRHLQELIKTWQKDRPVIAGQEQFRINNVVEEWKKVLSLDRPSIKINYVR